MNLLTRLTLCWRVLRARRPRHWLNLANACDRHASLLQWQRMKDVLDAEDALEAEYRQVAAGVRTTRQAARLLAEARRLVQPG